MGTSKLEFRLFALALLVSLLFTACHSTRPIVKIGLIAPFEGQHRRSGYEALAAMRSAIAESDTETNSAGFDILPLAQDNSANPARSVRTAQKMLVDPDVRAVIGPLTPRTAHAADSAVTNSDILWLTPFAIQDQDQDGSVLSFVELNQSASDKSAFWAKALVQVAGEHMQSLGYERMVIAGWTPGWMEPTAPWSTIAQMPVLFSDDPMDVAVDDGVLWLGEPSEGADYLGLLQVRVPGHPFWMGPQGGSRLFVEHAPTRGPVYWLIWLGSDYNQWMENHHPNTPTAYQIYQATRQAIFQIAGQKAKSIQWQVYLFEVMADGTSIPIKSYENFTD